MRDIGVDEVTRPYLQEFARLEFLPRWLAAPLASTHQKLCVGFLEEPFREALGLNWSAADEQRFRRLRTSLRAGHQHAPRILRETPWNLAYFDARRRLRREKNFL